MFFGITHQRSITASNRAAAAKREYEHKLHLIQEAKVAYAKSKEPVVPGMNAIGGCESIIFLNATPVFSELGARRRNPSFSLSITDFVSPVNQDPNDPKFDLESYLLALAKANP